MKSTKVTIILLVLLVASLGAGVYFFMSLQTANSEVQTLKSDNAVLQAKISKGLAYAEAFDILMWGGWKASGLTLRFQFADDTDALLELKNRLNDLGDAELIAYEKEIEKTGSDVAVVKAMDYFLGAIEKSLK